MPVMAGVKWTATKWIHTLPFHPEWMESSVNQTAPTIMPEECKVCSQNYWHTNCDNSLASHSTHVNADSSMQHSTQQGNMMCCAGQDANDQCAKWAESGECEKNPDYMKGDGGLGLGSCRLACGTCEVCKPKDSACRTRNRKLAPLSPSSCIVTEEDF